MTTVVLSLKCFILPLKLGYFPIMTTVEFLHMYTIKAKKSISKTIPLVHVAKLFKTFTEEKLQLFTGKFALYVINAEKS